MKLTIAVATALSLHEVAHGFVVPSAPLTISSASSRAARSNSRGLSMKADHMPMDRKNMLQSAALAFGAALATGNPSQVSAADVDYGKVSA